MATKVLIIKLGYSETLDQEIGRIPSLGDVLRTTPILWGFKEKYPDSHITWLVSREAEPLLTGNKFIDRLMIWDEFVPYQLMREKFDVMVNLEKIPGVCALSDMIDAWVKYGFRFESVSGTYHAYEKGLNFIEYIKDKQNRKKSKDHWQQVLIEMVGVKWRGQGYILGYDPRSTEKYDIGFNYNVGKKFQTKAMSIGKWKALESSLEEQGYNVSWQEGLKDLNDYIEWINSCRLLITQDSLGVHIALALKKRMIGLFGPTDAQEIYFHNFGKSIYSRQECHLMHCYSPTCLTGLNCMEYLNTDEILKAVDEMLGAKKVSLAN
ncbi:MAG TPA: glycosyltransferase family 9 protein [Nitrospirae bacterium]|nr:lipopolysaccharide core biosynthesis protein [bacterium BMS3Abin06]HDH11395.1 glycosyltransferase family 9 protein [Nitrospirota bacterium]HDZ01451.1 glycosyltransferase family 9 protein [Nitrospirota bacterium]